MRAKIEVRGISKTFPTRRGPLAVLDDISFSVGEGEFVAIIGPSGCGKSTLLGVLAGFEKADRGEVSVDGEPVREPRRTGIFIFQQPSLFPWLNLEGNLVFGLNGASPEERRRLVAHYISLVGLEGFEHAFPYQLSGGMQQRAELARALMVRPEILYMDEPFGALDALTRLRMRAELLRILSRERHTVLLVTHDVEEALHLADRVLLLSPRPAQIQTVIDVTLPRPRLLSSPALLALKASILKELGIGEVAEGAV
ncbi:MAG TPA: ABC transporter ATP-binding protein [Methylomirabilota bacterium]|jgi:ABC-type nitrate/sulfonate/bicarbonate transport system ATPase subunit|nr:ABC transporter ATP-binding protein [Methylomirabilota bacterium]